MGESRVVELDIDVAEDEELRFVFRCPRNTRRLVVDGEPGEWVGEFSRHRRTRPLEDAPQVASLDQLVDELSDLFQTRR